MSGKRKKQEKGKGRFRKEFVSFLIYFFMIWAVSFALTRMMPEIGRSMEKLVSKELAVTLDLLKLDYRAGGNVFYLNTSEGMEKLYIIAECTGIFTTLIYISIIGAFPARVSSKLYGLLIGVPAIHILNYLRVVFITMVLYKRSDLFELFHGYLWQISFVAFMLLLVFFWMSRIAVFESAVLSEGKDGGESSR